MKRVVRSFPILLFPLSICPRGPRERGASLVEYVLLTSLIALACVAALRYLGTSVSEPYSGAGSGLTP